MRKPFVYPVRVTIDTPRRTPRGSLTKPTLPATAYQSMLANGVKLHQDIDIPAKGDYILRIGVSTT